MGSQLNAFSLVILLMGFVLFKALFLFNSLTFQTDSQINALILRHELQNETSSYTGAINKYVPKYGLYQVKTYQDLLDSFVEHKSNWGQPRWLVFVGGSIVENKSLLVVPAENTFEQIWMVSIKSNVPTIIRVY